MFAVIGFCHRLTATSTLPDLANSLRHMCSVQGDSQRHWKLPLMFGSHRSTIKLDEKKVFLEVEDIWGPDNPGPSVTQCIEISLVFPKYLCQTPLNRHRLRTDASVKGFSQIFLPTLSLVKIKINIETSRGCSA